LLLTNVQVADNLPPQITVASPPAGSNGCGSGTVNAPAASGIISVTGLALTPGQTCTITVNVTSATVGVWQNTTAPIAAAETCPAAVVRRLPSAAPLAARVPASPNPPGRPPPPRGRT